MIHFVLFWLWSLHVNLGYSIELQQLKQLYSHSFVEINSSNLYRWKELQVHVNNFTQHQEKVVTTVPILGQNCSDMVDQPVYVTLATVSFRVEKLHETIITLLSGVVRPTKIFVFLSETSYLLDDGVKQIPEKLLMLAAENLVNLVYTDNIGPHRKLLPALSRFYHDDVLLITVDDDIGLKTESSLIYQLLRYYKNSDKNSVIALRARRIGICVNPPWHSTKYHTWSIFYVPGKKEMMLLPTGTGGILYRPQFFHEIVFNEYFRNLTGTADDMMFRLSCMIKEIPVVIACRDLEQNDKIVFKCPIESKFNVSLKKARETINNNVIQHRNLRLSLFGVNKNGLNDRQWREAASFLKEQKVLDLSKLIKKYRGEREKECYNKGEVFSTRCSIFKCRRENNTISS